MKLRILFYFFLLLMVHVYDIQAHSKTFFEPHQITTNSTYELTLNNFNIYYNDEMTNSCLDFFVMPFYQRSCNGNNFARYFLPNNKKVISVQENGLGDVSSLWLGIVAADSLSFSSMFSLAPTRKVYGADISMYLPLNRVAKNLWAGLTFAIVEAVHNLHMRETNITNPGTIPGFANVIQALTNPSLLYGRFYTGNRSSFGVDDIQLKIGYEWYPCDLDYFGLYGVMTFPTGDRPTAQLVFEPLVGTRNYSVGFGANLGYTICDSESSSVVFMADFKYQYYVPDREKRLYDLISNGDWSRYLLFVQQGTQAVSIPGPNVLTFTSTIRPKSMLQLWTSLHYHACEYDLELGYTLWWRAKQKISHPQNFPTTVGILDIAGLCGTPTSASTATISQSFPASDLMFTPITLNNLDLNSAAAPSSLTNTIYGAVGYDYQSCNYDFYIGIASSYEFATKYNALNMWSIWGDIGLAF